ncbi:MAG TPA: hypothetical protein GXX56_00005, partial [Rhodocyclaceae bacterium]|nr:hypothetical protein [Rhodocyclaceae bacterium]
ILHGLAGIIQAKVGDGNALVGAAAGALNEALLPEMEKFLDAQNITDPEARRGYLQLASAMLGAGIGAIADGTSGAALGGTTAYNATTYNRLLHPDQVSAVQKKAKELAGKDGLTAEEWEKRLTQQLLYQNDSYQQSFGNDPVAEGILKEVAQATGIDMDARGTAAYWNHAQNSEYLGQLAASYWLAGNPGNMNIDPLVRVMSQAAKDPHMVKQTAAQRKDLFDAMLVIALLLPPESPTSSATTDKSQSSIFTALNQVGNSLLGTGVLTAQEEEAVRQRQMQALVTGYGNAIAAAGLGTRSLLGGKANASAKEIIAVERVSQLAKEAAAANAKLAKSADSIGDGAYVAPVHTSKDAFQTHGLSAEQVPASIRNQLAQDLEGAFGQGAAKQAQEVINSGKSVPVPMTATAETKLYRVQVEGREFNSTSVYYMDAAQLQRVQSNPQLLQDMLGLPPGSKGVSYTIFERQPLPGQMPTIYQSSVATVTTNTGKISVGSGVQTILPNGSLWSSPVPIATVRIGG